MLDKLDKLLKENCDSINISLKNNDSFFLDKPNKGNIVEVEGDVLKWVQTGYDGCTYENYIKGDEIVSVTGTYNCPVSEDEEFYDDGVFNINEYGEPITDSDNTNEENTDDTEIDNEVDGDV